MLLFHGPEDGVNLIRERGRARRRSRRRPTTDAPAAHRARPGRRHPGRDEELRGGRGGPRLLGAAVQRPRAGRRGRHARGALGHPARRARVLGAKAAPEARNPDELRGLLRLGYASETIFDAARDMTWLVEQGEELHPVVQMALEETEEIARRDARRARVAAPTGRVAQGAPASRRRPACSSWPCSAGRGGSTGPGPASAARGRPADLDRSRGGRGGAPCALRRARHGSAPSRRSRIPSGLAPAPRR